MLPLEKSRGRNDLFSQQEKSMFISHSQPSIDFNKSEIVACGTVVVFTITTNETKENSNRINIQTIQVSIIAHCSVLPIKSIAIVDVIGK